MPELSYTFDDRVLRVGRLNGEIDYHRLGGAFMEALIGVVLGAEGLRRHQTHGLDSEDLWILNRSTTAQRIAAAEQVLAVTEG